MSHMPDFFPLFRPRPSFSPPSSYSFSIYNTINPNRRPYCCGYPTLFNTISSQIQSSIHPIFSLQKEKTRRAKRALFQGLQPASQISFNPRALDQPPTPICKVIKLFNSNNLIQTFLSFLSFLPDLIFFYSIFSFHITLWRYIPKKVITKSGYQS